MLSFNRCGNYLTLNFKIPHMFIKSRVNNFTQYCVTYLRPNGCYVTQMRDNLPRVVEFKSYEDHHYSEYIGCNNGLGWKIISIRLVDCKFRS